MQATYNNGTVGDWEDFDIQQLAALVDDPLVRHVKVRKMSLQARAAKNRAIQKRRAKNKEARKARRKS